MVQIADFVFQARAGMCIQPMQIFSATLTEKVALVLYLQQQEWIIYGIKTQQVYGSLCWAVQMKPHKFWYELKKSKL